MIHWLNLVETQLGMEEAKRADFWARRRTDILPLAGIDEKMQRALAAEHDSLKKAAVAYNVISVLVEECRPSTPNADNVCRAIKRAWRDVTVCRCARTVGVSNEIAFLRELNQAFDGRVAIDRDLSSSLMQAYHKQLADSDGAFRSRNTLLVERRGYTRPRALRNRVPVAAAEVPVPAEDQYYLTGSVRYIWDDGVWFLVHR